MVKLLALERAAEADLGDTKATLPSSSDEPNMDVGLAEVNGGSKGLEAWTIANKLVSRPSKTV